MPTALTRIGLLPLLVAGGLGIASRASGQQPQTHPPPRVWASATESFGLALGSNHQRSTIAHMPRVAAGLRLTSTVGIEAAGEVIRILDNQRSAYNPTGLAPSYAAAAASVVLMRPGRTSEWDRTVSIGAGRFQPSGQERHVWGADASVESAFRVTRHATFTTGARGIVIPHDAGSRFTYLMAFLSVRTRHR